MFDFDHTGQFGEHRLAGFGKAPISPPPQRTTVASGDMLNQHLDFSFTCVWTHGLYWEYCLTSLFFFPEKACLQCWTLLHLVTLWPACRAFFLTDLWSWWWLQIWLWWTVKYHIWLNPNSAPGAVFYMSVVILGGVVETVLGLPTAQLIGPQRKLQGAKKFPGMCVYLQDKRTKSFFYYFVFLAWNIKRCSKMMSRNSIRLIKGQKSNRTYLSCK